MHLWWFSHEFDDVTINLQSRKDFVSIEEAQFLFQNYEMRIKKLNSISRINNRPFANFVAKATKEISTISLELLTVVLL